MLRSFPRLAALSIAVLPLSCGAPADPSPSEDDDGAGSEEGDADSESSGSDDGAVAAEVSYWADAKPIIDAKCNGCHYEGGVAPFAMETYADAVLYAPAARAAIEAETMPPWHPVDGCRSYAYDRSLDEADRALLLKWIDDGTPEGDPALVGEPRPSEIRELPRTDLTLAMADEYTPQRTPDDHRCFVVDLPADMTDTRFITGTHIRPGNLAVVHHILVFHAAEDQVEALAELDDADPGPGYECFAGAGVDATMLGGWAPGGGAATFDDGMGVRVDPGGKVVIQVHYNTLSNEAAPDLSGIDLMLADAVDREVTIALTTNPSFVFPGGMPIPAGEKSVVHESDVPPFLVGGNAPVEIFAVGMHMHLLGRRGFSEIVRADGTRECLLQIDDWDFSWQGSYKLTESTILQPGDKVHFGCEFDNSPENQPLVDGKKGEPQYTEWGDGTTDEMCLVPLVFAPL